MVGAILDFSSRQYVGDSDEVGRACSIMCGQLRNTSFLSLSLVNLYTEMG